MSDTELLSLAAKAIGEQCSHFGENEYGLYKPKPGIMQPYVRWNPLTDDGDALRLAVKLKLDVSGSLTFGNFRYICKDGATYAEMDKCPYYATRRAIVRAAAEIGRSMK